MLVELKNLKGKPRRKNCRKYLIDWDKRERSQIQTKTKLFLQPYIKNHIVFSEFPVFGTLLKIDIFDLTTKIAYEIQGRQHTSYVKHFAKNRMGYLDQIKRDVNKQKFCDINNIQLIEIHEEDIGNLSLDFFIKTYNLSLI